MANAWTPYGLEHLRQGRLRKRRVTVLALVLLLAVGYVLAASNTTTEKETEIFANGQKQKSIGLALATQDPADRKSRPDATIEVTPGRTSRPLETDIQPEAPTPQAAPPALEVEPIDWMALLARLGPFILLATLLWLGFRRRAAPEDEVNFGVYKGAMPLEMITASHAHLVLTSRHAKGSLFGKSRRDYVDGEDD